MSNNQMGVVPTQKSPEKQAVIETTTNKFTYINGFTLKLIALLTMTIDHTAAALPVPALWYIPMRLIGRLAFPIYCFLLIQGYFHTRSVGRYLSRLLIAFFVAELPFDAALLFKVPDWGHLNVLLTLAIGLVTVYLVDHSRAWVEQLVKSSSFHRPLTDLLCLLFSLADVCLAQFCRTDYAGGGVLLILLFYFFRSKPRILCLTVALLFFFWFGWVELFGIVALIPITFYNGKRGPAFGGKWGKWFFYLYYALHLAMLAGMQAVLW